MLTVIIAAFLISGMVLFLGCVAITYRRRWLKFMDIKYKNLPIDLEMATTDQLLQELRDRNVPYMFLRPTKKDEIFNLSMEIANIDPVEATQMLGVATALSVQELKRRGYDLPYIQENDSDEE
jgi:predicted HTH domain antitoxin